MSSQKDKTYSALQLSFVIVCTGLFLFNVSFTTLDYFNRTSIRTQIKKKADRVYIPDMAVCTKPYFHNPKHHMGTIKQFQENTEDPRNIVAGDLWADAVTDDLYTHNYGWCLHIHTKSRVIFNIRLVNLLISMGSIFSDLPRRW